MKLTKCAAIFMFVCVTCVLCSISNDSGNKLQENNEEDLANLVFIEDSGAETVGGSSGRHVLDKKPNGLEAEGPVLVHQPEPRALRVKRDKRSRQKKRKAGRKQKDQPKQSQSFLSYYSKYLNSDKVYKKSESTSSDSKFSKRKAISAFESKQKDSAKNNDASKNKNNKPSSLLMHFSNYWKERVSKKDNNNPSSKLASNENTLTGAKRTNKNKDSDIGKKVSKNKDNQPSKKSQTSQKDNRKNKSKDAKKNKKNKKDKFVGKSEKEETVSQAKEKGKDPEKYEKDMQQTLKKDKAKSQSLFQYYSSFWNPEKSKTSMSLEKKDEPGLEDTSKEKTQGKNENERRKKKKRRKDGTAQPKKVDREKSVKVKDSKVSDDKSKNPKTLEDNNLKKDNAKSQSLFQYYSSFWNGEKSKTSTSLEKEDKSGFQDTTKEKTQQIVENKNQQNNNRKDGNTQPKKVDKVKSVKAKDSKVSDAKTKTSKTLEDKNSKAVKKTGPAKKENSSKDLNIDKPHNLSQVAKHKHRKHKGRRGKSKQKRKKSKTDNEESLNGFESTEQKRNMRKNENKEKTVNNRKQTLEGAKEDNHEEKSHEISKQDKELTNSKVKNIADRTNTHNQGKVDSQNRNGNNDLTEDGSRVTYIDFQGLKTITEAGEQEIIKSANTNHTKKKKMESNEMPSKNDKKEVDLTTKNVILENQGENINISPGLHTNVKKKVAVASSNLNGFENLDIVLANITSKGKQLRDTMSDKEYYTLLKQSQKDFMRGDKRIRRRLSALNRKVKNRYDQFVIVAEHQLLPTVTNISLSVSQPLMLSDSPSIDLKNLKNIIVTLNSSSLIDHSDKDLKTTIYDMPQSDFPYAAMRDWRRWDPSMHQPRMKNTRTEATKKLVKTKKKRKNRKRKKSKKKQRGEKGKKKTPALSNKSESNLLSKESETKEEKSDIVSTEKSSLLSKSLDKIVKVHKAKREKKRKRHERKLKRKKMRNRRKKENSGSGKGKDKLDVMMKDDSNAGRKVKNFARKSKRKKRKNIKTRKGKMRKVQEDKNDAKKDKKNINSDQPMNDSSGTDNSAVPSPKQDRKYERDEVSEGDSDDSIYVKYNEAKMSLNIKQMKSKQRYVSSQLSKSRQINRGQNLRHQYPSRWDDRSYLRFRYHPRYRLSRYDRQRKAGLTQQRRPRKNRQGFKSRRKYRNRRRKFRPRKRKGLLKRMKEHIKTESNLESDLKNEKTVERKKSNGKDIQDDVMLAEDSTTEKKDKVYKDDPQSGLHSREDEYGLDDSDKRYRNFRRRGEDRNYRFRDDHLSYEDRYRYEDNFDYRDRMMGERRNHYRNRERPPRRRKHRRRDHRGRWDEPFEPDYRRSEYRDDYSYPLSRRDRISKTYEDEYGNNADDGYHYPRPRNEDFDRSFNRNEYTNRGSRQFQSSRNHQPRYQPYEQRRIPSNNQHRHFSDERYQGPYRFDGYIHNVRGYQRPTYERPQRLTSQDHLRRYFDLRNKEEENYWLSRIQKPDRGYPNARIPDTRPQTGSESDRIEQEGIPDRERGSYKTGREHETSYDRNYGNRNVDRQLEQEYQRELEIQRKRELEYQRQRNRERQMAKQRKEQLQKVSSIIGGKFDRIKHEVRDVLRYYTDALEKSDFVYGTIFNGTRYDIMNGVRSVYDELREANEDIYDAVMRSSQTARSIYQKALKDREAEIKGLTRDEPPIDIEMSKSMVKDRNFRDVLVKARMESRVLEKDERYLQILKMKHMQIQARLQQVREHLGERYDHKAVLNLFDNMRSSINEINEGVSRFRGLMPLRIDQNYMMHVQQEINAAQSNIKTSKTAVRKGMRQFIENTGLLRRYQRECERQTTRKQRDDPKVDVVIYRRLKSLTSQAQRHSRLLSNSAVNIQRTFRLPIHNGKLYVRQQSGGNKGLAYLNVLMDQLFIHIRELAMSLESIRTYMRSEIITIPKKHCTDLIEGSGIGDGSETDDEDYDNCVERIEDLNKGDDFTFEESDNKPIQPEKKDPTKEFETELRSYLGKLTDKSVFLEDSSDRHLNAAKALRYQFEVNDPSHTLADKEARINRDIQSNLRILHKDKMEIQSTLKSIHNKLEEIDKIDFEELDSKATAAIKYVKSIHNEKQPPTASPTLETVDKETEDKKTDGSEETEKIPDNHQYSDLYKRRKDILSDRDDLHKLQTLAVNAYSNSCTKMNKIHNNISTLMQKVDKARNLLNSLQLSVSKNEDSPIAVPIPPTKVDDRDSLVTDIWISIKPKVLDGTIFYAVGNNSASYTLTLNGGELSSTVYKEDDNLATVTIDENLEKDKWYTVRIIRAGLQFNLTVKGEDGKLLHSATRSDEIPPHQPQFAHSFIGGVPEDSEISGYPWQGCVGEFVLNGQSLSVIRPTLKGDQPALCSDHCVSKKMSWSFDGDGYVHYDWLSLREVNDISFTFRTWQSTAFVLSTLHKSRRFHLVAFLQDGALRIESSNQVWLSNADALNDGKAHTFTFTRQGSGLELDGDDAAFSRQRSRPKLYRNVKDGVVLGAIISDTNEFLDDVPLLGCIGDLKINEASMILSDAKDIYHAQIGKCDLKSVWHMCTQFTTESVPLSLGSVEKSNAVSLYIGKNSTGSVLQYKKEGEFDIFVNLTSSGIDILGDKKHGVLLKEKQETDKDNTSFIYFNVKDDGKNVLFSALGQSVSVNYRGFWSGSDTNSPHQITLGKPLDDDPQPFAGSFSQLVIGERLYDRAEFNISNKFVACRHELKSRINAIVNSEDLFCS